LLSGLCRLALVWRRWLSVFDRKLRLAVIDAVERIEIAARALLSQTMSEQHGPHWFTHAQHFAPGFRHAQFVASSHQAAVGVNAWRAFWRNTRMCA
jgi:abortive infection bacteriophage resistance protein